MARDHLATFLTIRNCVLCARSAKIWLLCVSANAIQYSLKLKTKRKKRIAIIQYLSPCRVVFMGLSNSCKFFSLLHAQLCMQWKFGFWVINHWRFAPTYCRCTLEFYFTLFLRKCRNYQYVIFSWWSWDKRCLARSSSARSWREPSTASSWQDRYIFSSWKFKQMLIRLDYCYNSSKCWSGIVIVTIPGHCWHHADNREDAQLWCEEHLGLQRGGRHQPGGGWAEGDGVRCLLFNLLIFTKFWWSWSMMPSSL